MKIILTPSKTLPKAVKIDALLEDDSDWLSTTAKSGPGLITATR